MTLDEVRSLVRAQSGESLLVTNDHHIRLEQALIPPERMPLIFRTVLDGRVKDVILNVWLVGQECTNDGYKIVVRDDGALFGLASVGFAEDSHLVLVGWYGSLLSTFLSM